MFLPIDPDEVLRLYERGKTARLQDIALRVMADEVVFVPGDASKRAEARSILHEVAGYLSVAEARYGDMTPPSGVVWCTTGQTYSLPDALHHVGVPHHEVSDVVEGLAQGHVPPFVLDTVIRTHARVEIIHPDDYPYPATACDAVYYGLHAERVDTRQVLSSAERYFAQRDARFPAMVERQDAAIGVTNLLEMYGLTRLLGF